MVKKICSHKVFASFIPILSLSAPLCLRVSNIQQQLAQLANESWPGMAEADRDRLQLIKEKEALLQELQLIIQQRRSAEDVARLEEERRRLEEEIQRARATSAQGATERYVAFQDLGGQRITLVEMNQVETLNGWLVYDLRMFLIDNRLNSPCVKCLTPEMFPILAYFI